MFSLISLCRDYHVARLDLRIGDVVEIDRRRYDVVSDKAGGVALEPAITVTSRDLHERHGTRSATPEEFEHLLWRPAHRRRRLTVPAAGRRERPEVPLHFDADVWEEEVGRLPKTRRYKGQQSRRDVRSRVAAARPDGSQCEAEGAGGTRLPGRRTSV